MISGLMTSCLGLVLRKLLKMSIRVIVVTGSMGSGKTTVLGEASDILSACGIVHAAVDLDALGSAPLSEAVSRDLMYRNLASIWANCAAAGVNRLLLAEAVQNRDELDRIRRAIPDAELIVCRLTAELETMRQRVRVREPGMLREQFLARVTALNRVLDDARLEDFSIANENGSVTEVARRMLKSAGWLT
jgi:adenylylsulfate kinase-like enzyme